MPSYGDFLSLFDQDSSSGIEIESLKSKVLYFRKSSTESVKMEVMKLEPYLEQRRSHGNSGPIPCPQCGKLFAKEFDIKRHMFTHTGEKPFKVRIGLSVINVG